MLEINKIYLGDCSDWLKQIDDKSVDLIIIDPPFQMNCGGGGGAFGREKRKYHNELNDLVAGISDDILVELVRVMKKINIYIWCSKDQLRQFINFFESRGCKTDLLCWNKTNPVPTCNGKYLSDTEYLLFFKQPGVKVFGNYASKKKVYVTQNNKKDKKEFGHPTIKPIHIIKNLIENSSQPGDTILDCYLGSGTTVVAARIMERNFIGIEKNPEYFEIARKRLQEILI